MLIIKNTMTVTTPTNTGIKKARRPSTSHISKKFDKI